MTIDQLIEILQEAREDIGGDTEVRLMTQYNWPFENSIHGVALSTEMGRSEDDTDDEEDDSETVVYIVEGNQLGYGSKAAWDVAMQ